MSTAQKYWDKSAKKYAQSPVADEATYQRKLEETQSFLKEHMRVLEFGCGTGTTALAHAAHVAAIDAIDISQAMIDICQEKAEAAGVGNVHFKRATLTEFAADASTYDAVLGLNVLHLLPNRREAIRETARVLKSGGLFVTSTVCLAGSSLRFLRPLVPIGKLFGLLPDVFVLSEAELVQELEAEGFTIERQWHHAKDGIAVFIIARKQ